MKLLSVAIGKIKLPDLRANFQFDQRRAGRLKTEWNLIVLSCQLYGHVNLLGQHPTFSSVFNSQETKPLVNLRSIKTS